MKNRQVVEDPEDIEDINEQSPGENVFSLRGSSDFFPFGFAPLDFTNPFTNPEKTYSPESAGVAEDRHSGGSALSTIS